MALLFFLGALSALPLTHAHMQMMSPSPFRDPHANRPNEPKDYNILQPLRPDGSDFACKGYQWNTPWTTVATYEAGGTYQMQLEGSATHGGGSCQLSMCFDGGVEFKVIKSMEGGCPDQKNYTFKVPEELDKGLKGRRATGLFAWTWFNKIGNREMYMNCAVVDVKPKGSHNEGRDGQPEKMSARDVARANIAAQTALSGYPPLFVANLKSINSCVTKETTDVVFDNPGKDIAFADGTSRSASASFGKSKCTGQGSKSAGSSSSSSSPPTSDQLGGSSPGNNGQWNGGGQPQQQQPQSTSENNEKTKCDLSDGQWHPKCNGNTSGQQDMSGSKASGVAQAESTQQSPQQHSIQDLTTGKQPSAKVEKQLDAYLSTLYGSHASNKQREAAPVQQAKDEKVISKPAVKPVVHKSSTKNIRPQSKINNPFPGKHHTTLAHELDDVAGKDGPFESNYEGLHISQQPRTKCVRDTTGCSSPNRWIKRGECMWECSRKGRSTKRSTFVHEVQNAQPKKANNSITGMIESRLKKLEAMMSRLLAFVERKSTGKIQSRQDTNVTTTINATATATANKTASPSTTFDLFLIYLARLQTTVIECIRNIAATTPIVTDGTTTISIEVAPPAKTVDRTKRQLVIPDFGGIAEAMFLSLANGLNRIKEKARSGKGFDWTKVYDDLKTESELNVSHSTQTSVEPTSLALNTTSSQSSNGTASAVNATNPLQEAADKDAFKDGVFAAQQSNTPPLDPESDAAALLPYFFLPGPVLTSGVNVDWPGPNNPGEGKLEKMPTLVNDLGPGSEEQVRKWFEDLAKGQVDALTGGEETGKDATGATV